MKTAFFASDEIALGAIEFLKNSPDFPLACVVSNPDKPKGRGRKLSPNAVSQWAIENGIELMRPDGGADDATVARLRELGVELIIVMAYGCMLKSNVLDYGKYPCLNLHGSILPKYRGASPIETAIALGETRTGVSLMRIVKKMDAGAVCDVWEIEIGADDTAISLRKKFRDASPELLRRNLPKIADGSAVFVEQDGSAATYTRKFDKSDMLVDFAADGKTIRDRIRALGFGIFECGGDAIKVSGAYFQRESNPSATFGKVLAASASDGIKIACADGWVGFANLQKPCAKMMSAKDFFAGYKIEAGSVLKSNPYKSLLR